MKNFAVVLAGGVGARVGADRPKQLLPLAGRPVLAHSLAAFQNHPEITDILLMMHPDFLAEGAAIAADFSKVIGIFGGGVQRSDTTQLALAQLPAEGKVLLHDAARPLVSAAIISACLQALETVAAVSTVVPIVDTIYRLDPEITPVSREEFRAVQTPQGFQIPALRAAFQAALADPNFVVTDDFSVVLNYAPQTSTGLISGEPQNLKITTAADLKLAEFYLS